MYGRKIKTVPAEISGDFERFMKWADETRTLRVRTNADTPKDAAQAVKFGAEGIGLVLSLIHISHSKSAAGCLFTGNRLTYESIISLLAKSRQ